MSSELATLLVKLGLDTKDFSKGIDDAKKQAGGFTLNASSAFKGLSLAAGAGFAAITKGAVDAEKAQGEFMAATGRSRDEAKQFVSQMDALAGSSGSVGKSFQDITRTGTMVAQQFGTTGDKTRLLTENILEFSKVTKQDATQAAADLEDTLSSFGLTADDASGFMDQLVKSSQTYGTDAGPAALQALRDMSPALQAMGGDLNDGIGFLNLFEVAGQDAGTAAGGLNRAIKQLKPGQTIDDLIKQVSSIQDPLDRAKKATELFGRGAGPELAKVIQPGMQSLDDFKVSVDDSKGSVTDASTAMDTFGDRVKGWAQKALAGARELGQQFGPALSGAVAIAGALGPHLVDGVSKAWDFVKESRVVEEAVGKAAAAAGAVYTAAKEFAEHVLEGVKTAWEEAAGHGPIHDAITRAGALAGGVYTTAKEFVERVLTGIENVWIAAGSPGSGVIRAVMGAGSAAGAAFSGAMAAGAAVAGPAALVAVFAAPILLVADLFLNDHKGEDAVQAWVVETFKPLQWISDNVADFFKPVGDAVDNVMTFVFGPPNATEQRARDKANGITRAFRDEIARHTQSEHADYMNIGGDIGGTVADGANQGFADGLSSSGSWGDAVDANWQSSMADAAARNRNSLAMYQIMVANHERQTAAAEEIWNALAQAITGDMTGTLKSAKKDISSAMDDLLWAINHPMALEKDVMKIQGELNSKTLKDALASSNPEIAAEASQTQQKLLDLWKQLDPKGYQAAQSASAAVKDGLNDSYPGAIADAQQFVRDINAELQKLNGHVGIKINVGPGGEQYGHGGRAYASGGYVPANTWGNTVGEGGIERLDMLPGGGAIVTPLPGAAGATTINVPIAIYGGSDNADTIAEKARAAVMEALQVAQALPSSRSGRPTF